MSSFKHRPNKPWKSLKDAEERHIYADNRAEYWRNRKEVYLPDQKPCLNHKCGRLTDPSCGRGGRMGYIVLEEREVEMGSATHTLATKLAACPMCQGKSWLTPRKFKVEYDRIMQEYRDDVLEYELNIEKVKTILTQKLSDDEVKLLRRYWNM